MAERGRLTPALVSSEALSREDAAAHLADLTAKHETPAVLRVIRKRGAVEAMRFEAGRRRACLPFRADEWAVIVGPPFDRSGESCIKIRYADPGLDGHPSERTLPLTDYVWETMGMDRVRLQYIERSEDDQG